MDVASSHELPTMLTMLSLVTLLTQRHICLRTYITTWLERYWMYYYMVRVLLEIWLYKAIRLLRAVVLTDVCAKL